jgi:hypothetical protein
VGEGVGQGVGVGVRVILVFLGVLKGKRGAGGFFRFSIFLEGGSVAGQVFVLVCVRKEAAPLMCVLVGGVGVRQGCLMSVVCCEHGHDACGRCGCRREQGVGRAWNMREPRRWRREE